METLIIAIIILIVCGLLVWAIQSYLPVPQPFKGLIIVLIILIACLYLLHLAGLI